MDKFDNKIQEHYISFMLADAESFTASRAIVSPDIFNNRLQPVVKFIMNYADEYKTLPPHSLVHAQTNIQIPEFQNPELHREWYYKEIQEFSRKANLQQLILSYVEKLSEDKEDEIDIVKRCQDVLSISLMKDLGSNIYTKHGDIVQSLLANRNHTPTGFSEIDADLGGGLTDESLTIFVGRSGEGKSLILQNLGINWSRQGRNVIYISLELSEELIGERLIAMIAEMSTADIKKHSGITYKRMNLRAKEEVGEYVVKKMPIGTNSNNIRAFLKEYTIKTGIKPDVLLVDYLDIMHPNEKNVNVSDHFVKDKLVAEQLRSLADELKIPVVTASQFNRSGVDAEEFDHSHIAGGISKVNTADNLIYLDAPKSKKEKGQFDVVYGKLRTAKGTGKRVKLKYNNDTMRMNNYDDIPDVVFNAEDSDEDIKNNFRPLTGDF